MKFLIEIDDIVATGAQSTPRAPDIATAIEKALIDGDVECGECGGRVFGIDFVGVRVEVLEP